MSDTRVEELSNQIAGILKDVPVDVCARCLSSVFLGVVAQVKGDEKANEFLKQIELLFKE